MVRHLLVSSVRKNQEKKTQKPEVKDVEEKPGKISFLSREIQAAGEAMSTV